MSDSNEVTIAVDGGVWLARCDHELRARFEHLHALNSAWAVLTTFELPVEARHIVETARGVSAELGELARLPFELRDWARLPKLDRLLDDIEAEIRALAFEVPVAQLRLTLPARIWNERRAVLDLLDLMLVAEIQELDGSAGRISAIDYLITHEGTISQGVRGFGLRNARYIGEAKTHLQHILTACAINISRIDNWLTGTPLAKTRTSRFAKLYPIAA